MPAQGRSEARSAGVGSPLVVLPRDAGAQAPEAKLLARLLNLADPAGVTRLGVLTGLDRIGIPVAAAYRPNSRSIAVHQGKAATLQGAKLSAMMEAMECWHAETADLPLRLGSYDEMAGGQSGGRPVDPRRLPKTGRGDPATARLLWTSAVNLSSGHPLLVPYELVSADFTAPQPDSFGLFQATTNGLGAGGTRERARLHATCEVIERDAVALWHAAWERHAQAAIDPASIDGPASAALLARFAQAGVRLRIWDVTADTAVPAYVVLATEEDWEGVEPELGSGCHPDPDRALAAALLEAAQARLTRISGARDDFLPATFAPEARRRRHAVAARWLGARATEDFRRRGGALADDEPRLLDLVLRRLDAAGFAEVACVDLTRPSVGIPVVRVVVPGLEGPCEPDGEYRPGPRAWSVR